MSLPLPLKINIGIEMFSTFETQTCEINVLTDYSSNISVLMALQSLKIFSRRKKTDQNMGLGCSRFHKAAPCSLVLSATCLKSLWGEISSSCLAPYTSFSLSSKWGLGEWPFLDLISCWWPIGHEIQLVDGNSGQIRVRSMLPVLCQPSLERRTW